MARSKQRRVSVENVVVLSEFMLPSKLMLPWTTLDNNIEQTTNTYNLITCNKALITTSKDILKVLRWVFPNHY